MSANKTIKFFRPEIAEMEGYAPGEQPKIKNIIKLNTNENAYPPSPKVVKAYKSLDSSLKRFYPDPFSVELRTAIAEVYGFKTENVIAGNGSDDILTMTIRCFTDKTLKVACLAPSYSLYQELAKIQNAKCIVVNLEKDFKVPSDIAKKIEGANLFMIPRPNSPTGNSIPKPALAKLCKNFKGIVLIDEAYADFAEDNCLDFVKRFNNVIISRTMSKSYSLAGVRLGYAISNPEIIYGMMKVKDSYNVNRVTQAVALAAIKDQQYLRKTVSTIKKTREATSKRLKEMDFKIIPSEANFLFVSPPDRNGEKYFKFLRSKNIVTRYFPGAVTGSFVRITIGTEREMDKLLKLTEKFYKGNL